MEDTFSLLPTDGERCWEEVKEDVKWRVGVSLRADKLLLAVPSVGDAVILGWELKLPVVADVRPRGLVLLMEEVEGERLLPPPILPLICR